MSNIDPKDIETWNTKSSSHTGGGGTHPGNNSGDNGNNGGASKPVEPEINNGAVGFNLDRP